MKLQTTNIEYLNTLDKDNIYIFWHCSFAYSNKNYGLTIAEGMCLLILSDFILSGNHIIYQGTKWHTLNDAVRLLNLRAFL